MKKILISFLLLLSSIAASFGQSIGKFIGDKPTGYTISIDSLNAATKYNLKQTTAGQTFTVANLVSGSKDVWIRNQGSVKVLIAPGDTLHVGKMAIMSWCGSSWATTIVNSSSSGGSGTVTTVSVASANGFSGTVANPTTTPAITIIAGAITPTSVNSVVISGSSTPNLAVTGTTTISGTHSGTSSGTNTGDQTNISGNAATVTTNANLTGDVTSVGNATTLANTAVVAGSYTNANVTFDAKGRAILVSNGVGSIQPLGTAFTDIFINTSNWDLTHKISGSFTVSGNKLNIVTTKGTLALNEYITQNAYAGTGKTNVEQWIYQAQVIVPTITATSFGVWFGLQSTGDSTNFMAYSTQVAINMDATNKGTIGFYSNTAASNSSTTLVNNTSGLSRSPALGSINAGDTLIVFMRMLKNRLSVELINKSRSYIATSATLDYYSVNPVITACPNVGRFAIGGMGTGTYPVMNVSVYIPQQKNTDYCLVGDSEIKGLSLYNANNRAIDKVMQVSNIKISCLAQGGNKIEDVNTTELINLAPTRIGLAIGTNNIGAGDVLATFQTKYLALVSTLNTAGYVNGTTLFFHLLLPRNDFNVSTFNSWIRTTYGSAVLDCFTPFIASSGSTNINATLSPDNLHINEEGNQLYADKLLSLKDISGNIIFPIKDGYVPVKNTPVYTINNKLGIGLNNQQPRYNLDVLGASSLSAQLILHSNTSDNGFYLFNQSATQTWLSTGAVVNGSGSWIAKSTTSVIMDHTAASFGISINSGNTVGSGFTPTSIFTCNTVGMCIRTAVNSAFLNINSGNAAHASLNLGDGVATTTPVAGNLTKITDDLYFTINTGTAVQKLSRCLTGSATLDFPSTGSSSVADLTVTVTGAADGDAVQIGIPNASQTSTASWYGWVSSTNTVTIRYSPKATEDPASGTFKVTVNKN